MKEPKFKEDEKMLDAIRLVFFLIALVLITLALGILINWGVAFLCLGIYFMLRVFMIQDGKKTDEPPKQ